MLSWRIMPLLMEEIVQEFTSTAYYHILSQISYVIRSINISPKGFRLMLLWWTDHSSKVGVGCLVGRHFIVPWVELIVSWPLWFGGWNCVIESSSFQVMIIIALALMKQKWLDGFPNHQHLVGLFLCRESWLLFFFMFTTFTACVIILRIAFIIYSEKSPTGPTDRTPKPEYEQPLTSRSPLVRVRVPFKIWWIYPVSLFLVYSSYSSLSSLSSSLSTPILLSLFKMVSCLIR